MAAMMTAKGILFLLACSFLQVQCAAAQTVRIGVLLPLSGPLAASLAGRHVATGYW